VLYSLYEAQHLALAPARFMAELSRGWFGHPFSPWAYAPFARRLAASSDLFLRVTQRYEKPAWNIEADVEIALDRPFCKLVHFNTGRTKGRKVLIVAPLSGHHATLLRDTVRALLPENDVWVSDWVDARMVPLGDGPFHLADYVDYVRDWIRLLGPDVHVMSVCQPTVPVLAAISLLASNDEAHVPLTMTMMGGPIDARRSPTAVNNLATRKPYSWFEQNVIHRVPQKYPGFMRRVYPGFLQHLGFVAMNPDRHLSAHWDYFNHLMQGDGDSADAHRRFYDEYNAVLDMPAEYYLDTVKTVFQDFALPKGRMFVRDELVRPQAIRKTALLTIEGELDDISGHGQTEAAHSLCLNIPAARREHFTAPGVGHYGIFSGRRWREIVYPKVREFIGRFS
jgi:poly(3-hydroxybutyrate) depolymerase